jgi:hypothetical protein
MGPDSMAIINGYEAKIAWVSANPKSVNARIVTHISATKIRLRNICNSGDLVFAIRLIPPLFWLDIKITNAAKNQYLIITTI